MINAISHYLHSHIGLKHATTQPYGIYKNEEGKVYAIFKLKDQQDFNSSVLAQVMLNDVTEIDEESYIHVRVTEEDELTKSLEAGELKLISTK